MAISSGLKFQEIPLYLLTDKICKGRYELIGILGKHIRQYYEELKRQKLPETCLAYILTCEKMVAEVQEYIFQRIYISVPYLNEVADKTLDASYYSGGLLDVQIQDHQKLSSFIGSLEELKQTIIAIRTIVLHEDRLDNEDLHLLHNKMWMMEGMLNEILYIEEAYILPKIMKEPEQLVSLAS